MLEDYVLKKSLRWVLFFRSLWKESRLRSSLPSLAVESDEKDFFNI